MTQSRYFDQLILNQLEPKLFWRVYRLCWSQPQPQMCQLVLDDTTAIVSPESNQTMFCHTGVGDMFYGSCTVSRQIFESIRVSKHWQNDFKCLKTLILSFLWSNEVQLTPKFIHKPYRACQFVKSDVQNVQMWHNRGCVTWRFFATFFL